VAAAHYGRNSIGVEVDEEYFLSAQRRFRSAMKLWSHASLELASAKTLAAAELKAGGEP